MKIINKKYISYILLFISLVLMYSLLPVVSDDWGFYKEYNLVQCVTHAFKIWSYYSGRIFGEIIANYFGTRFILKILFEATTSLIFIILIKKLFKNKNNTNNLLLVILLLGMDRSSFAEIVSWFACYSHYMIPIICLIGYLIYNKKIVYKENINDNFKDSIICALLGFFMNLFVENATLLAVFMGILSIILSLLIDKKVYKFQITYLIFSIIGASLILSSPVYWGNSYNYRYSTYPWMQFAPLFTKLDFNLLNEETFLKMFLVNKPIVIFFIDLLILISIRKYRNNLKYVISSLILIITGSILLVLNSYINTIDFFSNFLFYLMVMSSAIWLISLFNQIYLLFKDNLRIFYWLLFLLICGIFSHLCLLFVIGGAYARCSFFLYLTLIVVLITLINELGYSLIIQRLIKILCIFVTLLMINVILCNYVIYQRRNKMLDIASKNNYNYVVLEGYRFKLFLHSDGEPYSKFHKIILGYYYKLNPDIEIYTTYEKTEDTYLYIDKDGNFSFHGEYDRIPKKIISNN